MIRGIFLILLAAAAGAFAAPAAGPDFLLSFDGTAAAVLSDGRQLQPELRGTPGYVPGIRGQAIEITRENRAVLLYELRDLIGSRGTVSFWIRPYWDGLPLGQDHYLLQTEKEDGRRDFRFWFWTWLRGDLPLQGKSGIYELKGGLRRDVVKNDWLHVAMSWNRRNWSKIYVNGEPVEIQRFSGIDLEKVRRFAIGTDLDGSSPFQGALDEVRIFRKALDDKAIREEYRRIAVFDLTMDESLVPAGRPVTLTVTASPLGTRAGRSLNPDTQAEASGRVVIKLFGQDEKVLAEKDFGMVRADGQGRNLSLPAMTLPRGVYRLEAAVSKGEKTLTRSLRVWASSVEPRVGTGADYARGEAFFTRVFDKPVDGKGRILRLADSPYLEAGSSKNERIYCEIPIPEAWRNGELLELEIRWPDDRPRSMGFYLHPLAGSQSCIRDRLGTGLASGNEYPLTGTMRTARYLVYAGTPSYLFEARTLAEGMPAAVASVSLRPVKGALPPLKIHLPEGMRGRSIGHLDEDQSFDYNLDWDNTRPKLNSGDVEAKILTKICEYYAYTGQNYFSLPLLRYDWVAQDTTTVPGTQGVVPFLRGSIPFWMKSLEEHGIEFVTIINFYSLPEFTVADQGRFFRKKNYFSRDKVGTVLKTNPFHPGFRKLLERQIEDFASRFAARKGLAGIDLWLEWDAVGCRSLDHGYDDETIRQFSRDSGVRVPEKTDDLYGSRYEFLTSPANRKAWTAWRAARTTEQIRRIRQIISRYNPKLPLYVSVAGLPLSGSIQDRSSLHLDVRRNLLEEQCLDLDAVNAIPGVMVVPMRRSTFQRWHECWGGNIATTDESIYDRRILQVFRRPGGNAVNSYRQYFESFSTSPVNDRYPGYFQNVDLKPHGRYFLKEPAYCLAFTDAQRIAMGAQPLATLGNEEVTREFTRAYRALPDLPFRDMENAADPVTMRYLSTKNGTYFYAVNLMHVQARAEVALPTGCTVLDLSSDQKLEVSGGRLSLTLKPFQLRSFLIGGKAVPRAAGIVLPEEYRRDCRSSLERLEKIVRSMAGADIQVADEQEHLKLCRRAMEEGRYAEFQRLINSKTIRLLASEQVDAFEKGFLTQALEMRHRGHVAVNCGSPSYFRTADGRLFLPDRKWEKDGLYGFLGTGSNVMRSTAEMPGGALKQLFKTELYNIDGYRFKAAPGKYRIRALLRVGYAPARRKGTFLLNAGVNGQVRIRNLDLFAAENKDGYAEIVLEDVSPADGVITLNLSAEADPTIRLLNAVELLRVEK